VQARNWDVREPVPWPNTSNRFKFTEVFWLIKSGKGGQTPGGEKIGDYDWPDRIFLSTVKKTIYAGCLVPRSELRELPQGKKRYVVKRRALKKKGRTEEQTSGGKPPIRIQTNFLKQKGALPKRGGKNTLSKSRGVSLNKSLRKRP